MMSHTRIKIPRKALFIVNTIRESCHLILLRSLTEAAQMFLIALKAEPVSHGIPL